DKAKAEARWSAMLEATLPKPPPPKAVEAKPAATPPPAAAPAAPAPAPAAPASTAKKQVRAGTAGGLGLLLTAFQVPVPPAVAPSASATPAPATGGVPILTVDQFQDVYQVASLAADRGFAALSMHAIREAVRGGAPTTPPNQRTNGGGMWIPRTVN